MMLVEITHCHVLVNKELAGDEASFTDTAPNGLGFVETEVAAVPIPNPTRLASAFTVI